MSLLELKIEGEMEIMGCYGCPLENTSKKVKDKGSRKSGLLFVGEAPHTEEVARGEPFVGASGRLLNKMLEFIGVKREGVVIANAIKCMLPKNAPMSLIAEAMKKCRPYLEHTIKIAKPKLIIALGDKATKQVLGLKGIMKLRGRIFHSEEFNVPVFVTVHPAYVLRSCHKQFPHMRYDEMTFQEKMFYQDFTTLKEILNGNLEKDEVVKYREMKAGGFIQHFSKSKIFAFDLEWEDDKLLAISISDSPKSGFVYRFKNGKIPNSLIRIMENEKITKVVANRPVDENMLYKYGCVVKGKVHDVFLMAHLIDENVPKISLEILAEAYVNMSHIKDTAEGFRGRLSEAPYDVFIKYSAQDADATWRLYEKLSKLLKEDKKVLRYYGNFLMPVSDALTKISRNGCLIDIQKLKENEKFLQEEADRIHTELVNSLPKRIKEKYKDNLSLTRADIIIDYLFGSLRLKPLETTPKTNKPTTSEKHLKNFLHIDFVRNLLKWKKLKKLISTYITPMYDYIQSDGRVYPQTFLYRTVTGRTAMTKPPIQQIPQRGEYVDYVREIFTAEEGWLMGAGDLSQSEIRIMAWQAKEERMLGALRDGVDIHSLTASLVLGKDIKKITKEERYHAKAVNFGFLYGMSAKGFQEYAKTDYGIEMSLKEAEEFRERYFKAYSHIELFHRKVKKFVSEYGYVYSPLGRKRRLPEIFSSSEADRARAERQAVNFIIQSFSSDLGLLGLKLFQDAIEKQGWEDKVKILWFIHDAVFFTAREDIFDEAMKLFKNCMEKRTKAYIYEKFKLVVDYPIVLEGKKGTNWANLKEIE